MLNSRILLVEDDAIIAMGLESKLESWGCKVCKMVASGEEAVNESFRLKPDLILMDIGVRGEIDGVEAVRRISSLNIPVIYLTGRNGKEIVKKAHETLPYALLKKPINHEVLKHKIRSALEKQEKREKKIRE
ncbi:MAG: two-component response regulator [Methanobacterium sp. PtaB.Bin024]|jgi:CheY-like chemotaxis protein|nr:MAG: two-component response regulator [Methanobacterium sp. PtaB.Bin024]